MDGELREQTEILALLDARGTKQTWLAREIGLEPTYLGHILHGRRKATPGFHRRVARALRVRLADVRPAGEAVGASA